MSLKTLDPAFRPWAEAILRALQAADPTYTVTSARRSKTSQRALYDRYRAGKHPVTVAPPGCSKHELGFAVDIATSRRDFLTDPLLREIGQQWRSLGGEWGGEKDPVHFALPGRICSR